MSGANKNDTPVSTVTAAWAMKKTSKRIGLIVASMPHIDGGLCRLVGNLV
jgi:hypothetical protein